MSNNRDKKIFEKNKIWIYRSTLTLDRCPETYKRGESARLAKMPVTFNSLTREGDLLLDDEGREDGVGGWV
jgi:hypothetical protein